jgi:hypothetical protein
MRNEGLLNRLSLPARGGAVAGALLSLLALGAAAAGAFDPVGQDLRISNATDVGGDRDARDPAVAYNPAAHEYLGSLGLTTGSLTTNSRSSASG